MISQRTTAVLATAKAQGINLGNPNGARALRGLGNAHAVAAVKAGADAYLSRVLPVIEAIRGEGMTSKSAPKFSDSDLRKLRIAFDTGQSGQRGS